MDSYKNGSMLSYLAALLSREAPRLFGKEVDRAAAELRRRMHELLDGAYQALELQDRDTLRVYARYFWIPVDLFRYWEDGLPVYLSLTERPELGAESLFWAHFGTSVCYRGLGELRNAAPFAERALRGALALEDSLLLGYAHLECGVLAILRGEWETANRHLEKARNHFLRADFPLGNAEVRFHLAVLAQEEGNHTDARALLLQVQETYSAMGNYWGVVKTALNLAHLAVADGRLQEAESLYEGALRHVERLGDPYRRMVFHYSLGRLHLMRGRLEAAERCFVSALYETVELPQQLLEGRVRLGLAALKLLRGETEEANAYIQDAARIFRKAGDQKGLWNVEYHRALVEALYGEPALARQILEALIPQTTELPALHIFVLLGSGALHLLGDELREAAHRIREATQTALRLATYHATMEAAYLALGVLAAASAEDSLAPLVAAFWQWMKREPLLLNPLHRQAVEHLVPQEAAADAPSWRPARLLQQVEDALAQAFPEAAR